MKPSFITSHLGIGLVALTGVGEAFPTADNLARLAQRASHTPEQFHERLLHLKEKRLVLDPLSEPIQGTVHKPAVRDAVM
jgi:hypothetical protein